MPVSVGTVARSCSCFECEDIRIVDPRCDPLQRSARNSSKGAQYLLHRSRQCSTLADALQDCQLSVAFSRWCKDRSNSYRDIDELLGHPVMQELATSAHGQGPRVAFVFGREEAGMTDAELDACDAVCSIPIGRLQESLSLSHAVSLALSRVFQQRQRAVGDGCEAGSEAQLAAGWEEGGGKER